MRALLLILIGLGLTFLFIKYLEHKGLYYPSTTVYFNPSSIGLPYEDITLTTIDNLKLNGWLVTNPAAKDTLLFLHGNAGNIGDRMEKIKLLCEAGFNVFIIDYRGFGKSEGRPTEAGFYRDAAAAYNYLLVTRGINTDQIILYGESLGTAIAINLASQKEIKSVILEGAFSSGQDIAVMIYPFIPRFFFANSFDSLSKIKNVNAPILFIHSTKDEVIPLSLAKKLYNNASDPKEFVEISGDHNLGFLDAQDRYITSIMNFTKNTP